MAVLNQCSQVPILNSLKTRTTQAKVICRWTNPSLTSSHTKSWNERFNPSSAARNKMRTSARKWVKCIRRLQMYSSIICAGRERKESSWKRKRDKGSRNSMIMTEKPTCTFRIKDKRIREMIRCRWSIAKTLWLALRWNLQCGIRDCWAKLDSNKVLENRVTLKSNQMSPKTRLLLQLTRQMMT